MCSAFILPCKTSILTLSQMSTNGGILSMMHVSLSEMHTKLMEFLVLFSALPVTDTLSPPKFEAEVKVSIWSSVDSSQFQ